MVTVYDGNEEIIGVAIYVLGSQGIGLDTYIAPMTKLYRRGLVPVLETKFQTHTQFPIHP